MSKQSKEAWRADQAAKDPAKEAQFFVRPTAPSATPEALADTIADGLIAQVNERRAKKGLPPLPDK